MSKLSYRTNIEELANRTGHEPKELISQVKQIAREISESAADCFQPHEIAEYDRTHTIRGGRLEHAKACASCAALIEDQFDVAFSPSETHHTSPSSTLSECSSPALADRLWSYRTMSAAAAVLIVGIMSIKVLQRRPGSAPGEVVLMFPAEHGSQSVTIPITAHGNKISSESYIQVAAATTVAEGVAESKTEAKKAQGFVNVDMTSEDLRNVSSALAAVLHSSEVDVPTFTPEQHKEVLDALVRSFNKTDIKVARMNNGDVGLYRDNTCVGIVKPNAALTMTAAYTKILEGAAGDPKALDNQLKNISFTLEADGNRQVPRR